MGGGRQAPWEIKVGSTRPMRRPWLRHLWSRCKEAEMGAAEVQTTRDTPKWVQKTSYEQNWTELFTLLQTERLIHNQTTAVHFSQSLENYMKTLLTVRGSNSNKIWYHKRLAFILGTNTCALLGLVIWNFTLSGIVKSQSIVCLKNWMGSYAEALPAIVFSGAAQCLNKLVRGKQY